MSLSCLSILKKKKKEMVRVYSITSFRYKDLWVRDIKRTKDQESILSLLAILKRLKIKSLEPRVSSLTSSESKGIFAQGLSFNEFRQ